MSKKLDSSKHARALAELGASKGGRARAKALTPEERSEISRYAAEKRWGRPSAIPRATHGDPSRPLRIGDLEIPCYVLEDGRRVLIQRGVMDSLHMAQGTAGRGPGDRIAKFVRSKALESFVSQELAQVINNPIKLRTPSGSIAYGYEATILADLCDAVLAARRARKLHHQQRHIAERCEILVGAFARVGIIALVDEATGYQAERARDELNRILEAYIAKELLPWTKRFPDEFFKQIYRLHGWEYREGHHGRPRYVGRLVHDLVYNQLPDGVLPELKRLNPPNESGHRRHRYHQFLTPHTGHPHLDKQILEVTTLLRVSDDKNAFKALFDKGFPRRGQQLRLDLVEGEK